VGAEVIALQLRSASGGDELPHHLCACVCPVMGLTVAIPIFMLTRCSAPYAAVDDMRPTRLQQICSTYILQIWPVGRGTGSTNPTPTYSLMAPHNLCSFRLSGAVSFTWSCSFGDAESLITSDTTPTPSGPKLQLHHGEFGATGRAVAYEDTCDPTKGVPHNITVERWQPTIGLSLGA
jgi:hypothetical protein